MASYDPRRPPPPAATEPAPPTLPAATEALPAATEEPAAVDQPATTDDDTSPVAPADSAMDAAIAATLALLPSDGAGIEVEAGGGAAENGTLASSLEQESSSSAVGAVAAAAAAGDGDAPMRDAIPASASLSGSSFPIKTELATPFPFPAALDSDASTPTTTQLYEDPGRPLKAGGATKASAAPLSRVSQLNARIEKDPLDGEARLALLADAEQKGDLERTREVYEDFLRVFPDAAQQWIAYVDLELSHSFFPRVEALFARCLRPSPSVDLWKFYLDYIRRVNPIDPSLGDRAKDARGVIGKSFEFALGHVGQDRQAGDMWMEYIAFLKEGQNRGTWEDQQRMDALRKAYQRAVQIPLNNVEQIWQEYNQFENSMNKMTAKKFVSELSPSYMTARKVLRELRALYDAVSAPTLALPRRPDWSLDDDRATLEMWRKYVAYEEGNPLDIEEPMALQMRIAFAYKKAVASLRFFSEIWYLASNYNLKLGKVDEARALLQSGMTANPSSLLLGYTLAELEEGRGELPACYKIYDDLISHFHARLASLETATEQEIVEAMAAFDAAAELEEQKPELGGFGDEAEGRQKTVQEKEEAKVAIRKRREEEVNVAKRAAANVWITEMRFARRAEGIKQARSVFTKARKSPFLAWQVYEASATMELLWNNEPKIATNIFELGLKSFSQDPEYILQYLDFLIRSNNPNNARALFERTVALVEPAKAKPVWDRMSQYEYQYGDFLAAQKIFQRYSEAFPEASPIERFAQRHGYLGLDDAITQDLGLSLASTSRDGGERRSRSPSPRRLGPGKRGPSAEPRDAYERGPSLERAAYVGPGQPMPDFGAKRLKQHHAEGSPAPSSTGGGGGGGGYGGGQGGPPGPAPLAGGWGRAPREEPPMDDYDLSRSGRRRPLDYAPPPHLNRPVPYALDSRGETVAILPDAVVFFLSILPGASSFNGPLLNPASVVDVIGSTMLPGTAPGPGLPGERLGIPPRPKPPQQSYGGGSPRRGGGGGGREPDYGYGGRDGGGRGGGGGGGGGGQRPRY